MDIFDKLVPVGHLEIIKQLPSGEEELLFEDSNVICSGLARSIAQYMTTDCTPISAKDAWQCGIPPYKSAGEHLPDLELFQTENGYQGQSRAEQGTYQRHCDGEHACLGIFSINIDAQWWITDKDGNRHETYDCTSLDLAGNRNILQYRGYDPELDNCPPGFINNDLFTLEGPVTVHVEGSLLQRTASRCNPIRCENGPNYAGVVDTYNEDWNNGYNPMDGTFTFSYKEIVFLGCCDGGGGVWNDSHNWSWTKTYNGGIHEAMGDLRGKGGMGDDAHAHKMLETYGVGGSKGPTFVPCTSSGDCGGEAASTSDDNGSSKGDTPKRY